MYRIVLVDDEPLILAGIASLICWEKYDCTIIGKATNGTNAVKLIVETQPDIVITDIRMPVMDGLELVESCKKQGCNFAFIFLTNLEDFQLAKKAVRLGATDYLVKLDLSEESLVQALERAKQKCDQMSLQKNQELFSLLLKDSRSQLEYNYFFRLLLGADSQDTLPANIELSNAYSEAYILLGHMKPEQIQFGNTEPYDFHFIRNHLLDIVHGIASRYFSSHSILMPEKDRILLVISSKPETDPTSSISDFCNKILIALSTYFGLTAQFGISTKKTDLSLLPSAYEEATEALNHCYYDSDSPIEFFNPHTIAATPVRKREFNINFLKKSMSAAVLQNEASTMKNIFFELSELFCEYRPDKAQALSACINIYTYLHDLFQQVSPEEDSFPYSINIAEQLSNLTTLDDILQWINSFGQTICNLLAERKESRSSRLVYSTKQYINKHYAEKLTLSDISEQLNISAGHLSSTFSRHTGITISDYIAQVKIEHARELIDSGQYLIYEIADQLGFENAYYFSKVFKKVTGISPREYENSHK